VCEEIKRSDDAPSRRASRELFAAAFQIHPYQRPVTGWADSVRTFTRDKVLEFYRRHYAPENMVLVAVGDWDEHSVREQAQATLGGPWDSRFTGPVVRPAEPAPLGRRVSLKSDEAQEAYLHLAFHIPQVGHPDAPALDVLAMLAGQGEASRLVSEVKRKRGLVNQIGAYAYTPADPGLFMVSCTGAPAHASAALGGASEVLAQLCAAPVPADELDTVKRIFEAETVYQRETVEGLARKLGFYESGVGGLEAEARYYEQVAALTPERIQAVARQYLRLDQAVVTGLLPPGCTLDEAAVHQTLDRAQSTAPAAAAMRGSLPAYTPLRVTAARARRGATGVVVERLASGTQVVVREESAVPLVAFRAAFPGGQRHETDADCGLTRLLAKTLTRGTPHHDAEEIPRLVDAMAGGLGAAAGRNSVSVRGEFLSRHFRQAFDLFTDVLLHPTFPERELERERRLALQDVSTREDRPSALAFELFHRTLYRTHPYRLSLLGEAESLARVTPEALVRFHREHLNPGQLTLCVVGDVRADEVLALAESAFGKAAPGPQAGPALADEGVPQERRNAHAVLPRAQSHLVWGTLGAKFQDEWRYALDVLCAVLAGQGGRLFLELRDKRSLAYSVSCFSSEGLERGTFGVYMGTSPEKVPTALAGIEQELERIRDTPVSPAELERAQRNLVGSYEIGLQRNAARAGVLALDHAYGLGLESFLHRSERLFAVTAADVQAAAQRVVDLGHCAVAVVGPQV